MNRRHWVVLILAELAGLSALGYLLSVPPASPQVTPPRRWVTERLESDAEQSV